MNHLRRLILKGGGAGGALACALAAGLLRPSTASAAEWNKTAFEAKAIADALKNIAASGAADSAEILIKAPDIAENGAVVPIEVTSRIAGAESIALLVEKNPFPLLAYIDLVNGAEGYINTRFKMGQTSVVKVVVKAGGKHYIASREVKVTIGGCGG
ncbi:MAG: thiosulfate oxidation carrier protein SoxY [Sulfuritalea sp.]|jgi:sulfur-oxidizing protein SoxY|nr:thiosulfate oxidation carrier protein SoxY [Sulfuritalea sp.]